MCQGSVFIDSLPLGTCTHYILKCFHTYYLKLTDKTNYLERYKLFNVSKFRFRCFVAPLGVC